MAYTISIRQTIKRDIIEPAKSVQICDTFQSGGTYTDTAAYDGTVYDTNVHGWGETPVVVPYEATGIPMPAGFGQIHIPSNALASHGTIEIGANSANPRVAADIYTVRFTVEDYKEAVYYAEMAKTVKDQGIEINIIDESAQ